MCDRLLADGHSVVGLDNLITGSRRNLEHLAGNPQFRLHRMRCDASRSKSPGRFDHVWHLASLASPKDYLAHPIETLESGSTGTRNMLEIARRDGARFLITSTSECYGDPLEHPQVETYWGNVNPVGMRSCYDESKRYAEAMTMAYHRTHGVRTNIARIFNTYGPRMALNDGRVVPAFLDQALRGAAADDFRRRHADAQLLLRVAIWWTGWCGWQYSDERYPVNLGNPVELTILEFAERIQAADGIELPSCVRAAAGGRSAQAAAGYFEGETVPGVGAEGCAGRRVAGDDRVLQDGALAGRRASVTFLWRTQECVRHKQATKFTAPIHPPPPQ